MVTEWGMSEKLGPLNFAGRQQEVFLGKELGQNQNHSPQTAQLIDDEVRAIVMRQFERAKSLLAANLDQLGAIARALLEHETLDGADLKVLMAGGSIARARPTVRIKTREQIEDDRKQKAPGIALGGPAAEPAT